MKHFFIILFSFISLNGISQLKQTPPPNWLSTIEYSESPEIDLEEVNGGYIKLLIDNQVHIPQEAIFTHISNKIIDNIGVQNASTISVDYDPQYQELEFHFIRVKRDGEFIDKLNLQDFQHLRKEINSDSYIYDGTMTAILNLSDIRKGDIIEYSYTLKGFNPIHKGMYSGAYILNDAEPMGMISLIIISDKSLNFKLFNSDLEPEIDNYKDYKKYSWEALNYKSNIDFEVNTPNWKILYANIFVSNLSSWNEVVDWGVNIYSPKEELSPELMNKITFIKSSSKNEGQMIKSTLSFVQDEIRYLSLSEGIGAYKPNNPNKVFKQRFGDCKDKSLLMVSMLNKMGIEAYPMLVNTTLKHVIKELPPSPKVFDHCVVKVIDSKGNTSWFDPTIANQGGNYGSITFPAYHYGLVLKPGNGDFDSFFPIADNLIETFDEFKIDTIGQGATLDVKTIYHEAEADNMRAYFKANSLSSISKDLESYYSNQFANAKIREKPRFEDDSLKNLFVVYESYQLDSIWEPYGELKESIAVSFTPYTINDILLIPDNSKRTNEFALVYPSTRRHKIKIHLPSQWDIKPESDFISNKNFYFSIDIAYNKRPRTIDLNYYYKNQEPYVNIEDYEEYFKTINKVGNQNAYYIYIPKSEIGKGQYLDTSAVGSDNIFPNERASAIVKKAFMVIALVLLIAVVSGVLFILFSRNRS